MTSASPASCVQGAQTLVERVAYQHMEEAQVTRRNGRLAGDAFGHGLVLRIHQGFAVQAAESGHGAPRLTFPGG